MNRTPVEICGSDVGAGDESRTRDLNLGKVALYQLSYSRVLAGAAVMRTAPLPAPGFRVNQPESRRERILRIPDLRKTACACAGASLRTRSASAVRAAPGASGRPMWPSVPSLTTSDATARRRCARPAGRRAGSPAIRGPGPCSGPVAGRRPPDGEVPARAGHRNDQALGVDDDPAGQAFAQHEDIHGQVHDVGAPLLQGGRADGLARPARSARISITTSSAMPLPMCDHDRPHPHVGMLDQQVAQFAGQHQ